MRRHHSAPQAGGAGFIESYLPSPAKTPPYSNWRGPICANHYLLIENLRRFYLFYADGLKIECPTRSGVMLTLDEIADELCRRLLKIFRRGPDGRRPVFGGYQKAGPD